MYRLADGDAMMIPQRDAATWSCRLALGQAFWAGMRWKAVTR